MPVLSNAFGSSNIASVTTPMMSLYTTKMTVTPTDTTATGFFPFTDLQFSPADTGSREIASCHVPAILHLRPQSGVTRKAHDLGIANGRESYPAGSRDPDYNDTRAPFDRHAFGAGVVDFLWSKNHFGQDVDTVFKQFHTEEEAVKFVGDHPTLSAVSYVITPRTVKIFYHESMIRQIVARLREMVEELGSYTPSVSFLGLGHVENVNQVPRKRKKGDSANEYQEVSVRRPSRIWNAGVMGWKGGKYSAQGSIYIPMDYMPHNTLKRSAKYNHILTQIGFEWAERLRAVGADWENSPRTGLGVSDVANRKHKEELAMLQLLFGSFPAMGFTDSLSPGDTPLDASSIITGMREYLTFPFVSGHTHLDLGLLGSLEQTTITDGRSKNAGLISSTEINLGNQSVAADAAFNDFLQHHILLSVVLAAFEGKFKVPLYPAVFMHEGGPRPEHVQQRMMMNFRPDRDYGGTNDISQFTLIPARLAPGEVVTRVPTLMHRALEHAGDSQGMEVNTYLGPRDPVVISDVKPTQYFGDRPETIIEDEFYYASPVIKRDGTIQTTYRNYRHVTSATVQRPPFFTANCTILGALMGFMSHHSPVSGPVYEQPLLNPYNIVREGRERSVHFNNRYDASTRASAKVERHIDGQSFRETANVSRRGLDDTQNPQSGKHWAAKGESDNPVDLDTRETIFY